MLCAVAPVNAVQVSR